MRRSLGGGGVAGRRSSSKQTITEGNQETQICEVIGLSVMYPDAVRVTNPSFLTEDIIEGNELVITDAARLDFGGLWNTSDLFLVTIFEHDSEKADEMIDWSLLSYRIALPASGDVQGATETTKRFVLDVTYPATYPPSPPMIKAYTNLKLPDEQQAQISVHSQQILQEQNPLFQERVVPLCAYLLDKIRMLVEVQRINVWEALKQNQLNAPPPSSRLRSEGNASPANSDAGNLDTKLAESSAVEDDAKSKFRMNVLKELGVLATDEEDGSNLSSQSSYDESESNHSNINRGGTSSAPPQSSRSPQDMSGTVAPTSFLTDLYDLSDAETYFPTSNGMASSSSRRKRPRRRRATESRGALTRQRSSRRGPVNTSEVLSAMSKSSCRLLSDFELTAEIIDNDGNRATGRLDYSAVINPLIGRHRLDCCDYQIHVVRVERFLAEATLNLHTNISDKQVRQIGEQLVSAVLTYTQLDNPHLGRINAAWSEELNMFDVAQSTGVTKTSLTATSSAPGLDKREIQRLGDTELCVIIQSDLSGQKDSPKVLSPAGLEILTREEKMLARLAQQILETLAYIHHKSISLTTDFSECRVSIDGLGLKAYLGLPSIEALLSMCLQNVLAHVASGVIQPEGTGLRPTTTVIGGSVRPASTTRIATKGVDDRARYGRVLVQKIVQNLKLADDLEKRLNQHDLACVSSLKSPAGACEPLIKADVALFAGFVMKVIQAIRHSWRTHLPMYERIETEMRGLQNCDLMKVPSAVDLLMTSGISTPFLRRDTLKDILQMLSQPASPEALAITDRLVNKASASDNTDSTILLNRRDRPKVELSQQLVLINWTFEDAAESNSPLDGVLRLLLKIFMRIHYSSFTSSVHYPSCFYKDVLTKQILASAVECLNITQLDLPYLIPACSVWTTPTNLLVSILKTGVTRPEYRVRALKTLQASLLLGTDPGCEASRVLLLTSGNFLLALPRSLSETLDSILSSNPGSYPSNAHVVVQSSYCSVALHNDPLISLRSLWFRSYGKDELGVWIDMLIAIDQLLDLNHHFSAHTTVTLSFPRLVRSLMPGTAGVGDDEIRVLSMGKRRLEAVPEFDSWLRISKCGAITGDAILDLLQMERANLGDAEILDEVVAQIQMIREFLTTAGLRIDVLFDLLLMPPINAETCTCWGVVTMNAAENETDIVTGVCGDYLSVRGTCAIELSLEALHSVLDEAEDKRLAAPEPQLVLSHQLQPHTLIVIQHWKHYGAALSLATRLRSVGIPTDIRVRIVMNIKLFESRLSGVFFLVSIRQVASHKGTTYRVDYAMKSRSTFQSEAQVIAYLLGHLARTKGNIRSAALHVSRSGVKTNLCAPNAPLMGTAV